MSSPLKMSFKIVIAAALVSACGDKTKDNKSGTESTDTVDPTRNDSTKPPETKPTTPQLNPSKLDWDGSSFKGTAELMIVPMD